MCLCQMNYLIFYGKVWHVELSQGDYDEIIWCLPGCVSMCESVWCLDGNRAVRVTSSDTCHQPVQTVV